VYECVMAHIVSVCRISMSHVTHMNESCLIRSAGAGVLRAGEHVPYMNVSCHAHE